MTFQVWEWENPYLHLEKANFYLLEPLLNSLGREMKEHQCSLTNAIDASIIEEVREFGFEHIIVIGNMFIVI